jgi:pimeloyl-ACP methyl ester carboxylesterase
MMLIRRPGLGATEEAQMDCQLEDINVHYESIGKGRPVLMLHGWSLSHRHLLATMEPAFASRDGWRRLYLDLPGHGQTPGRKWISSQDKILEVVLAFIDKVVPGQRLAVVGASAGAYLARGVAYHRSGLLDGLLLVVPMIIADDARRIVPPHTSIVRDPQLMAALEPADAEVMTELAVVQSRRIVDALHEQMPSAEDPGDTDFQTGIRNDPRKYGFSFDVDHVAAPMAAPTLIVAGRQDSVVGYRQAWEIIENYPRGTFVVLDRAGHLLEMEQEEVFRVLVGEWLDRVEEYAATTA